MCICVCLYTDQADQIKGEAGFLGHDTNLTVKGNYASSAVTIQATARLPLTEPAHSLMTCHHLLAEEHVLSYSK